MLKHPSKWSLKYGHNCIGLVDWFQDKNAGNNELLALLSPQETHSETHLAPRLQHDKLVDLWKEASIEALASEKSVAVQFPWWQFACCGKISVRVCVCVYSIP